MTRHIHGRAGEPAPVGTGAGGLRLSFYDHHRQSYGAQPVRDGAEAEFMLGDYGEPGEDQGVGVGGEFAIHLIRLGRQTGFGMPYSSGYLAPMLRVFHDATGSLRALLDSVAWDAICEAGAAKAIRSREDLRLILVNAGLYDRSDFPPDHRPVCACCGRATALTGERAS